MSESFLQKQHAACSLDQSLLDTQNSHAVCAHLILIVSALSALLLLHLFVLVSHAYMVEGADTSSYC